MAPAAIDGKIGIEPKAHQGLVLGALGVVYGDIGTSPLYTMKQCFDSLGGAINPNTVYGVLSLVAWALFIVVTLKYVIVIMRADNRGQGGTLALTALALRSTSRTGRRHRWILAAGLIGASLFYGDGVITPAISVLSAIEGLKLATPVFEPYILPIAIVVLLGLFLVQRHGTGSVGGLFGPIMALWFVTLGLLGAAEIIKQPGILRAFNPLYGIRLLTADPWEGFILLGAVVLAVTGAEALYADMGHFGARPIRTAWLRLVFPALLLNYFGQGALLLADPTSLQNPFYRLAPDWALYPMVVLAAMATVIASQAVISGAFSMTHQAVQLGYLPRLFIRHTSEKEFGQIYVPKINLFLLLAVLALVLGFKSSDNIGAAYGIAVTGTMSLDCILALIYMVGVVGWNPVLAIMLFGVFLTVDLGFFTANMIKIEQGGWFPLMIAALTITIMWSWISGRTVLGRERSRNSMPLELFLKSYNPKRISRVPGTAVFMTSDVASVPAALLHNLKHNKVLHERVVLMHVEVEDIPHVPDEGRLEFQHLEHNFHVITLRYGFMDEPNIPRALAQCRILQFRFNLMETSFFLRREKIVAAEHDWLTRWQKQIFILLSNVMLNATEFFRIPTNRVIELGGQIEI
jgi:KUP system potassium uptake protein